MKNNFDRIAFVYDPLARLVFRNNLNKTQNVYLDQIPDNSSVLIVGGGTGWILEALDGLSKPLHITFLDASSKMIEKARKRAPFRNLTVKFQVAGFEYEFENRFDVIITNFFLDVFNETNLPAVISTLRSRLKNEGQWMVTDFEKGAGWWQDTLITFMYYFFRWSIRLEGKRLLHFRQYLEKVQLKEIKAKKLYHGMIRSSVYRPL